MVDKTSSRLANVYASIEVTIALAILAAPSEVAAMVKVDELIW
jgi:hypothetical protein